METIVFLDSSTLDARIRPPAFAHRWLGHATTLPEEVVPRLQAATIAVTNKVRLTGEQLRQLPGLRAIAIAATGTDNVDLAAARELGVAVFNIRDYAVHGVPEHVFMLMLALKRNVLAYRAAMREGAWQRHDSFALRVAPMHDLHGATLGVVGYGAIGRAVAELGRAFGMRVLAAERKGESGCREGHTPFEKVLAESHVLSLHCPLTDATRHLIGRPELERMRLDAILINTARGALIDEGALVEALQTGRIAGAGLDVLSVEPPREGNPLLELDLPNLIVTPHVAWASQETMQALADQLVDNLEAFQRGEARNRVV